MWNNLPIDILASIFCYLSPDSLARAKAACRNWYDVVESIKSPHERNHYHHSPWFVAFPARTYSKCQSTSCYVHNPIEHNWHVLSLNFITGSPVKPIATVNGLILLKLANKTSLELAICNPFTRQFKTLPLLNVKRTNPALGLIIEDKRYNNNVPRSNESNSSFKIYVAGGMSEAAVGGGAMYQPTVEMYDSSLNTWQILGAMPAEFSVRLTVWTPNEGVCANGVLYWITSARAYSVMGFEIETNRWRELSVPMADKLGFASLVSRTNGSLAIVGGTCDGGVCIWELGDDDNVWCVVEKLAPFEFGNKMSWDNVKCVGCEGVICLYKDNLGPGIILLKEKYRDNNGLKKWELDYVEGSCEVIRSGVKIIQNFGAIKGLLMHPNLSHSFF